MDSDFPHFISVIIRTKYRIKCLLSNVSNDIRRSCVNITMFDQIPDVSECLQVRQDARLPIWSQEGQDKVRTPSIWASHKSLFDFSFPLLSVEKRDHWRLDLRYLISWRMSSKPNSNNI